MKKIVVLLSAVLMLAACEYETIVPKVVDLPDDGQPISFSAAVQPIFVAKCSSCHAGMTPILTQGNVYNSLKNGNFINTANPMQSGVYLKAKSDHPSASGKMTATELAYLLKWIEEGALNN